MSEHLIERQQRIADDLDDSEENLSEWEGEFLDTCLRRLDSGERLSPKQWTKLQEIHDRVYG